MEITFTTESGSIYQLDFTNMKWARIEHTENSGPLRTKEGNLLQVPDVELGKSVVIFTDPLSEEVTFRTIITTPVVTKFCSEEAS